MGQAKRRGTFEERRAEAERRAAEAAAQAPPKPRIKPSLALMLAALAGHDGVGDR